MSDLTTEKPFQSDRLKEAYGKLFSSGVLMQVHVSKWGMASKLAMADLKVEKELPSALFQLGKKLLIPAEEKNKFERLEGKARAILGKHAFVFPIAQAHFVPGNKIMTVLAELEEVKKEYNTQVDAFLANYEVLKAETIAKYPEYQDVLAPYYPPVAELRHKFGFRVSQFQVDFPKEMHEVSVQDVLTQQDAKEEALTAYKRQMAEQYDQALETMHTFVNESVATLREEAAKVCSHVYQKIKRGEPVIRTNINTISEMITNFEAMNFFEDAQVAEQLGNLKRLVNSDADFRLDEAAVVNLSQALQSVVEKATMEQDVSSLTGSYFRSISL